MNPIEESLHVENTKEEICNECKGFGCKKCGGEGFKLIKKESHYYK